MERLCLYLKDVGLLFRILPVAQLITMFSVITISTSTGQLSLFDPLHSISRYGADQPAYFIFCTVPTACGISLLWVARLVWSTCPTLAGFLVLGCPGLTLLGVVSVVENRNLHSFGTFLFVIALLGIQVTLFIKAWQYPKDDGSTRCACCVCCCSSADPAASSRRLFKRPPPIGALTACVALSSVAAISGVIGGGLAFVGVISNGIEVFAWVEWIWMTLIMLFLLVVAPSVGPAKSAARLHAKELQGTRGVATQCA